MILEREKHRFVPVIDAFIGWFLCVLQSGNQIHNLVISGCCFNQLSYLARALFLNFWEMTITFFTVAVLFYSFTNNTYGFQFLHILDIFYFSLPSLSSFFFLNNHLNGCEMELLFSACLFFYFNSVNNMRIDLTRTAMTCAVSYNGLWIYLVKLVCQTLFFVIYYFSKYFWRASFVSRTV